MNEKTLSFHLLSRSIWWEKVSPDYIAHSYEEMMLPALQAAESNMPRKNNPSSLSKQGGPFGAATYIPQKVQTSKGILSFEKIQKDPELWENPRFQDVKTWSLFGLGTNLVVEEGQAFCHAEIVAGLLASEKLKKLGCKKSYNLWNQWVGMACTSAPCEMCQGYLVWSRPRALIVGTQRKDTIHCLHFHEAQSQEENPKDENHWSQHLESVGIQVIQGVLRKEIISRLFHSYAGPIYNSGEEDR